MERGFVALSSYNVCDGPRRCIRIFTLNFYHLLGNFQLITEWHFFAACSSLWRMGRLFWINKISSSVHRLHGDLWCSHSATFLLNWWGTYNISKTQQASVCVLEQFNKKVTKDVPGFPKGSFLHLFYFNTVRSKTTKSYAWQLLKKVQSHPPPDPPKCANDGLSCFRLFHLDANVEISNK